MKPSNPSQDTPSIPATRYLLALLAICTFISVALASNNSAPAEEVDSAPSAVAAYLNEMFQIVNESRTAADSETDARIDDNPDLEELLLVS